MLTTIGLVMTGAALIGWILNDMELQFDSFYYHWHIQFWSHFKITSLPR